MGFLCDRNSVPSCYFEFYLGWMNKGEKGGRMYNSFSFFLTKNYLCALFPILNLPDLSVNGADDCAAAASAAGRYPPFPAYPIHFFALLLPL